MNFRISFILLVLLAVVGGYVLIFELQRQPEKAPDTPWFYDVAFEDINSISVTYREQKQVFIQNEQEWVFEDTGEPLDIERWSGIPFLLSGPRSVRVVQEQIDNPSDYGLDPPQSTILIGLKDGRQIGVLLGDLTPDGISHYGQTVGSAPLFLIHSSWGDIFNRLVTEPPAIIPTPEPTPTSTPTPTTEG